MEVPVPVVVQVVDAEGDTPLLVGAVWLIEDVLQVAGTDRS
jgi:hypothetical protein